jgi:crossover junction endodeoxyribonuclease RusA
MILTLPFPPSLNHYYRHVGAKVLVSADGRAYRDAVGLSVLQQCGIPTKLLGRLHVRVLVFPPDNRRRDLDNTMKALLDAIQASGVYGDDSQIDHLEITRMPPAPGGYLSVAITEVA